MHSGAKAVVVNVLLTQRWWGWGNGVKDGDRICDSELPLYGENHTGVMFGQFGFLKCGIH